MPKCISHNYLLKQDKSVELVTLYTHMFKIVHMYFYDIKTTFEF